MSISASGQVPQNLEHNYMYQIPEPVHVSILSNRIDLEFNAKSTVLNMIGFDCFSEMARYPEQKRFKIMSTQFLAG